MLYISLWCIDYWCTATNYRFLTKILFTVKPSTLTVKNWINALTKIRTRLSNTKAAHLYLSVDFTFKKLIFLLAWMFFLWYTTSIFWHGVVRSLWWTRTSIKLMVIIMIERETFSYCVVTYFTLKLRKDIFGLAHISDRILAMYDVRTSHTDIHSNRRLIWWPAITSDVNMPRHEVPFHTMYIYRLNCGRIRMANTQLNETIALDVLG